MPGVLEGRLAPEPGAASRARAARSPAVPALVALASVVVGGSLLRGGGSQPGPLFWIGSAAVLAAAIGAAAVAAGALPRPALGRAGLALVAFLAAFAVWSGITVAWSIGPDRSWDSFNRATAYVAVLALGFLVGAAVREARVGAGLLAGLLALTLAWALVSVVVPAVGPDVSRSARLREPVEYWNALALLAAVALPLWLWLGRALGAVAVFGTVVALILTTSRGGFLVAAVAVAAWLALSRTWRQSAWLLLLSLPPGVAVGVWALTTPVAETGSAGDTRAGALLGVVLLALGAVVFLVARRPAPGWAPRAAVALGLAGLVAAAVVAVPRLDDAWDEFRNPPTAPVTNEPSRLTELSSNFRWTWWREAWAIFQDHPAEGAGAGTFELARRPIREDRAGPIDPHNLPLKALGETGIVGFLLLAGAVGAAVAVAVEALRRTAGVERAAAAALAAGGTAWLAHSLVDMPWEYVAATAPCLFALGLLVAAGRPETPRAPAGRGLAAVPVVLGLAVIGSLLFPWLAERRLEASLDALGRGDVASALDAAGDAQRLNPLSIEPFRLQGAALEVMARYDEARTAYEDAVRLQPENAAAWYELARFEFERGGEALARRYLQRSRQLDPLSPAAAGLLGRMNAELPPGPG